jgi:hypothetical protein
LIEQGSLVAPGLQSQTVFGATGAGEGLVEDESGLEVVTADVVPDAEPLDEQAAVISAVTVIATRDAVRRFRVPRLIRRP